MNRRAFLGALAGAWAATKAVAAPRAQPAARVKPAAVEAVPARPGAALPFNAGGEIFCDLIATESFQRGDVVFIETHRPKYACRSTPKRVAPIVCGIATHNAEALTRVRVLLQGPYTMRVEPAPVRRRKYRPAFFDDGLPG